VWLTTITLPAWHCYCKELNLKSHILSHNIVTHWNSMYYMLSFVIRYCAAIDAMTANKSLKLWKFELETEEWAIAKDLVSVLLVHACAKLLIYILTFFHSNTKMQPCFSPKTVLALPPLFLPWTRLQATSTTRLGRHIIPLLQQQWSLHARRWITTTHSLIPQMHTALPWFYTLAWNSSTSIIKSGRENGSSKQKLWSERSTPRSTRRRLMNQIWHPRTIQIWTTMDLHPLATFLSQPVLVQAKYRNTSATLSRTCKIPWSGGQLTNMYIQTCIAWLSTI